MAALARLRCLVGVVPLVIHLQYGVQFLRGEEFAELEGGMFPARECLWSGFVCFAKPVGFLQRFDVRGLIQLDFRYELADIAKDIYAQVRNDEASTGRIIWFKELLERLFIWFTVRPLIFGDLFSTSEGGENTSHQRHSVYEVKLGRYAICVAGVFAVAEPSVKMLGIAVFVGVVEHRYLRPGSFDAFRQDF